MEHGAYNLQNIIYKQQQQKTLTGKRGKKKHYEEKQIREYN